MAVAETDQQLLASYVRNRSEDAFAEIVRRHLDLVHSAALRQVCSAPLAEEVAQCAFVKLAHAAPRLTANTILTAWLYQVTRSLAIDAIRRETRRKAREQTAVELNAVNATASEWAHIEPLLDEAMHALDDADRAAVLLRYFEKKSLREVGELLGTSDDAAQKRVSRSVERLRDFFSRRGITVGAGGLVACLSTNAIQAAPVGLSATICHVATATVGAAGTSLALFKFAAMTKLQTGIVGALVIAGVATPWAIHHRGQARLRAAYNALQPQMEQVAALTAENRHLSNLVAQIRQTEARPTEVSDELLRLRAEVARWRTEAQERASFEAAYHRGTNDAAETAAREWAARVSQLKHRLEQVPQWNIPELQHLTTRDWLRLAENADLDTEAGVRQAISNLRSLAKQTFSSLMMRALHDYAKANDGQLPTSVALLKPHFKSPINDDVLQRYEMLKSGRVSDLSREEMVVGEKQPVDAEMDTLYQIGLNGWQNRPIGAHKGVPP